MSQPEQPLQDSMVETHSSDEGQGAGAKLDRIDKVVVKLQSKQLEVHALPPFGQADSGLSEAERLLRAKECVSHFATLSEVCAAMFPADRAKVKIQPPVWTHSPMAEELKAIVFALVDWYSETEAVAGNWLARAQWTVEAGGEANGSPELAQIHFSLTTPSELAVLQKKKTAEWLKQQSALIFGVSLSYHFAVIEESESYQESLREQLRAAEMKEVQQIADREAELKKQTESRPEPAREEGGRGGGFGYRRRRNSDEPLPPLTLGRTIDAEPIGIKEIADEMRRAVIQGRVFRLEKRTLPSGRTLVQFNVTDETDSISAKVFVQQDRQVAALEPLTDGVHVKLQGSVQFDTYAKELVFMIQDMMPAENPERLDTSEKKRVELHLHTPMSSLDGITPVKALIAQAARWGHTAIAVTDHGVAQAFPEAYSAGKKHGVQVILGVEAYVLDDGTPIVYRSRPLELTEGTSYVVFDTETTGLNAREDTLIEIAAVKVQGGKIVDEFASLIDPKRPFSAKIAELTGITEEMVLGQPVLEEVLPKFADWVGDSVMVAHNAEFDVGFLGQCAARIGMAAWTQPVIDTLALARTLYPGEKNYRLKTLTNKFQIELTQHHRALADSEATGKLFLKMLETLAERSIRALPQIEALASDMDVSRVRPFHATLLVQNQQGLRNLYELISLSHTKYLYRTPRIPRSELVKHRDGLLIGTACQQGELVQGFLRGKSMDEIEEICRFYDYLEIQPIDHYETLVRDEMIQSLGSIRDMHQQIVALGKKLDKPVVATGDVHYLNPNDSIYREIFLQSQHSSGPVFQPPLYFRTTNEMLDAFGYLGDDAMTVVVDAPAQIAASIESVKPIPDELFTPVIEGAEEEITRLAYDKAKRWYGDPLPELVEARLKKELNSIISNGFAVIYLIAHKLVVKSLSDGYLVGSRGSVGSSFVATMTDITEVNPLAPHYRCPSCVYSEFMEDGSYGSGYDLPEKACPKCGTDMIKDGQDIPFETFLGFNGDKVPDIDLNFSGEYQPRAHKYTEELFGKDHVFRAGTISVVAEKTAYGYVKKFAEERGMVLRNAEIDRLVLGCTGVKRTTGQHPGGQVVVPSHESIYNFTPVQHPADDKEGGTLTTHFDYHSGLENCLLKLDILGHDDPTVIRMLQDLTGVDPKTIPLDDELVLGLFRGTETLGVEAKDLRSVTGTYAIPEFGTKFVRQMLEDTRPTTFSELVRISGLSHGTDVWLNNAQDLIRNGTATLSEVICARDDIMVYLIYKGLDPARAFKIMESIRKGKGVKDEDAEYMREHEVPEWYIESGRRIKYMFPKAHAAAYVLMAMRIAWFKVHHPLAFYATYFSVRADDFDVALMASGKSAILKKIEEIEEKGNAASPKEKSLLTVLEVALEMVLRGYRFLNVDLYKSYATKFQVSAEEDALLPPFAAIPGVGDSAAASLHAACQEGTFLSKEELQSKSRVSKTVMEILESLGCLEGLPETNQLSLF